MNKHGLVKRLNDEWVIEYSEMKRNPKKEVIVPSITEQPIKSGKRRVRSVSSPFIIVHHTIPVAGESHDLCVESKSVEYEVIKEEGKDVAKILVYKPEPHTDWTIGILMGEIIWCRKLTMHRSDYVLETLATAEEKAEYKRASDAWFDTGSYGSNKNEELNKKLWIEYRTYARSLNIKYLPHEIEYSSFVPFDITDVERFVKGITRFLWDTDACHYTFTKDDVQLSRDSCFQATLLRIKFTLSDLVEEIV